jgi:hypothetical protein
MHTTGGMMSEPLNFSRNAFKNGPAFVAELEAMLATNYSHEAIRRVIRKTLDAYASLQLAIIGSLPTGDAEQTLRLEIFNDDFKALQMRQLSTLISSFIALETPNR